MPIFGLGAMVDGGFAMGANLPLFAYGESEAGGGVTTVTTSDGETVVVPENADFGTVSSGGLY
jgi:penicillin-binding protein 1A